MDIKKITNVHSTLCILNCSRDSLQCSCGSQLKWTRPMLFNNFIFSSQGPTAHTLPQNRCKRSKLPSVSIKLQPRENHDCSHNSVHSQVLSGLSLLYVIVELDEKWARAKLMFTDITSHRSSCQTFWWCAFAPSGIKTRTNWFFRVHRPRRRFFDDNRLVISVHKLRNFNVCGWSLRCVTFVAFVFAVSTLVVTTCVAAVSVVSSFVMCTFVAVSKV